MRIKEFNLNTVIDLVNLMVIRNTEMFHYETKTENENRWFKIKKYKES
jgi:hypothetical protein